MNDIISINNTDNINKTENAVIPRPTVEQIEQEINRIETGREIRKALSGTVKNIIVIAAAAILLTNLLISTLVVNNRSSMSPTMKDGDALIALRWVGVKPGDVIAFYYNNQIMLKRVIAKAGDWVNIDQDGTVYVNDKALDEPYITQKSLGNCDIDLPYQVPDGSVFVMGDNRASSADSRLQQMGPINTSQIVGKVFLRIWPLSRINYFG
ncbi:MAG: signal peptidase I [Oscillospiraceae bacterium]|nr:signal peptidase I [Oscillospiraceae bacterium]